MKYTITKDTTPEEIRKMWEELAKSTPETPISQLPRPTKKQNLSKYAGKLTLDVDPVAFQRKVRDEWE